MGLQKNVTNDKEFNSTYGLNTFDYGARQHDSFFARRDRLVPLCEKYYGVSPYAYCANNPVRFIDPDGNEKIFKNIPMNHSSSLNLHIR